jgi:hypothetical protein
MEKTVKTATGSVRASESSNQQPVAWIFQVLALIRTALLLVVSTCRVSLKKKILIEFVFKINLFLKKILF